MRVHAHRRALERDVRAPPARFAQRVADCVLHALRAITGVVDGRVTAAEIAGERAIRIDVFTPRQRTQRRVQGIGRFRPELRDLEKHPAREARLETGAISSFERTLERDAERELVPYCAWANVGILPYFPLAGGLLTGKYTRGEAPPEGSRGTFSPYVKNRLTDANFDKLDALRSFADSRGHTLHDLAFSWLLSKRAIPSVIAGATTPEQVSENAKKVEWKLSEDDLTELKELL